MLMRIYRPKTKKGKFALLLLVLLLVAGLYFFIFKDDAGTPAGKKDPHADTIAANNLNCGLSVPTEVGQYYISGAPKLKKGNLNYADFEGERVRVVGYVYEGDTKGVKVPSAKIEIWQPDSIGLFYPADNGKASEFDKKQLALRGTVVADEFGYFEFTTIYPGESEDRARHIYIKGSAEGHEPVTTQLVMSRSGDITSLNVDPVALELPNCNVMNFGAVEGVQTAGYDFHLEKKPEAVEEEEKSSGLNIRGLL
jgi:protocatechuate 3,4-dioxygenase beta subunit